MATAKTASKPAAKAAASKKKAKAETPKKGSAGISVKPPVKASAKPAAVRRASAAKAKTPASEVKAAAAAKSAAPKAKASAAKAPVPKGKATLSKAKAPVSKAKPAAAKAATPKARTAAAKVSVPKTAAASTAKAPVAKTRTAAGKTAAPKTKARAAKAVSPKVKPSDEGIVHEAVAAPAASVRDPGAPGAERVRPALQPKYELVRPSGKKAAAARTRVFKEGAQHFSDADLADFRKRLLADREAILSQLRATRADALRRSDEDNVEEDGSNSFARSADLSRADEQHTRLHAIDDALRAIEKKTYGICQVCHCLIPRDRLRAAPFAIRCVSCKAEYEKNVAAAKRSQNP